MNYDMNMDTTIVYEEANNILKLTDSNSDFKTLIDEMIKLVNDMEYFWISNSQVETVNELINSLNYLKSLQSSINNVANISLKISKSRESLENKISKLLSNL